MVVADFRLSFSLGISLCAAPLRLGFAVKVLGKPGPKSNDAHRWQQGRHLRVSLGYVREIFVYLKQRNITMYRLSSGLAAYPTHPDPPQFRNQMPNARVNCATLARWPARKICGSRFTLRNTSS